MQINFVVPCKKILQQKTVLRCTRELKLELTGLSWVTLTFDVI